MRTNSWHMYSKYFMLLESTIDGGDDLLLPMNSLLSLYTV